MVWIFEVDKEIPRDEQDASWEAEKGLVLVKSLHHNTDRATLRRMLRDEAATMAHVIVDYASPYFTEHLLEKLGEALKAKQDGKGRVSHERGGV